MAKKVISEKEFKNILKESLKAVLSNNEELLCEMATIGTMNSNGTKYTLTVHGDPSYDRQTSPHMHAIAKIKWKGKDNAVFNLEISLIDILVKNQLTILRIKIGNKVIVNSQTTDWSGYSQLKKDLEKYLFTGPVKYFGIELLNNLHLCIWQWNNEFDNALTRQGVNVMRLFLESKGIQPLDSYQAYLTNLYDNDNNDEENIDGDSNNNV